MQKRETEILKLISFGYGRKHVCEEIAERFKCTQLAAEKQYDKLLKSLHITDTSQKEDARSVFIQRYEYLFKTAVQNKNLKTASDIIDKQAKLLGLYDKDGMREEAPQIIISGKPDLQVVPGKAENEDK